jgi:pimeloyl-ACP methyl ester carboxylesterase
MGVPGGSHVSAPLHTILLPGLDGTGRLFAPFLDRASGALDFQVLSYPPDRFLGYDALASRVREVLPRDRPYVILGESFGGPLALRVAATAPQGLAGVVLAASFHHRPAARVISALRLLSPAYFRMPLPAHGVRLLLAGSDGSDDLVRLVQDTVARVKGSVMAARAREAIRVDVTEELRSCPVPILFLGGKRDRLLRTALPIEVRALRADAEIRMLDAPHLALQTRPEEAMRLVETFALRCVRGEPARPAGATAAAG